jgi:hypothetical protein
MICSGRRYYNVVALPFLHALFDVRGFTPLRLRDPHCRLSAVNDVLASA